MDVFTVNFGPIVKDILREVINTLTFTSVKYKDESVDCIALFNFPFGSGIACHYNRNCPIFVLDKNSERYLAYIEKSDRRTAVDGSPAEIPELNITSYFISGPQKLPPDHNEIYRYRANIQIIGNECKNGKVKISYIDCNDNFKSIEKKFHYKDSLSTDIAVDFEDHLKKAKGSVKFFIEIFDSSKCVFDSALSFNYLVYDNSGINLESAFLISRQGYNDPLKKNPVLYCGEVYELKLTFSNSKNRYAEDLQIKLQWSGPLTMISDDLLYLQDLTPYCDAEISFLFLLEENTEYQNLILRCDFKGENKSSPILNNTYTIVPYQEALDMSPVTRITDYKSPEILILNPSEKKYDKSSEHIKIQGLAWDNVKVKEVFINGISADITRQSGFVRFSGQAIAEGGIIEIYAVDESENVSETYRIQAK